MPPGQPPGSLGFLAPTVLPLPSAASRQNSPGGAISIQPHGRCTWDSPHQGACSLGRQGRGGRRRVRGLREPRHPKLELCWGGGGGLPNAERTPRLLSLLGTKHLCAEALPPAPVKLCNRQGETLKIRKNTPMRPPPHSAARSQPMAGFGGLMGLS